MRFVDFLYDLCYLHNIDSPGRVFPRRGCCTVLLLLVAIITGYGVIFHTIHYMREAALNSQIEQHQAILLKKLEIMEESEERPAACAMISSTIYAI